MPVSMRVSNRAVISSIHSNCGNSLNRDKVDNASLNLQVNTTEMPTFIKHLAWLVRTNGILPYVHFIDTGQNIIGNICQYGNLHISTKNKTADKKFKDAIEQSSFTYFTDKSCYNKFSKSGAIKGRTITV